MDMQSSSSFSSFSSTYEYDVFLSFRGSDTRYSFTSSLYNALNCKGIRTFIDNRELHGGEEITPALFKAIENSMIFIPVLSINYASSSFCLEELVHIMECSKANNRLVLPIFYDVEPTHVRHQTGSYAQAFANHKKKSRNTTEMLQKWKMALNQVANLSGYHFFPGKVFEYEFIGKIVDVVSSTINRTPLHVADYPIGLESRVCQVKMLLKMGYDVGVCFVGIHGVGGIGKTTLAREVYNSIANQFEVLCFLDSIREKSQKLGLVHLQETLLFETIGEKEIKLGSVSRGISIIKQRLQSKKILLILDDVNDLKQLQVLVGEPHWFGSGSRVIITTRDTNLLASHGIETTYEVEGLNKEEALELLRYKAFKNKKVDSKYELILKRVVTYASGLPLALEVVGSTLCGKKNIEEWESFLSRCERVPPKGIWEILEISFEALEKEEQSVFLDIACCFRGYNLGEVEHILCAQYGVCMKCNIQVLIEKSLIKIDRKRLHLHDLIEAMGKEIVRQESLEEPEKRSRLWFHEDIVQVLEDNMGGRQIKMMHLDFPLWSKKQIEWKGDELKNMKKLKTLILKNCGFSKAPEHFPESLRVLIWHGYPSQYVPFDVLPKKLSICKLAENCFESFELPNSIMNFQNLKELNFDHCHCLTQIHDVSALPNLEIFSFKECVNLITIHDSVGLHLKKLKKLSVKGCPELKSFPPLNLISVKKLKFSNCQSLQSFPEILGELQNIKEIRLMNTSIEELPLSFQNLTGLEYSQLIGNGTFRLSRNTFIVPRLFIGGYSQSLTLHNDDMSFMEYSKMNSFYIGQCKLNDVFLRMVTLFPNLTFLVLSKCEITNLPECFKDCSLLVTLHVIRCDHFQEIRGIPPNLKMLFISSCYSLTSSCRRMLLNQELHENGGTKFYVTGGEVMPDWFEYQIWGPLPFSFWFRTKIPVMALYLANLCHEETDIGVTLVLFINGYIFHRYDVFSYQSILLDLRTLALEDNQVESKVEKELLQNEWIHVKVLVSPFEVDVGLGIHIWKQKNSMEDIQFTDPKTGSGEDFSGSKQWEMTEEHRAYQADRRAKFC